MKNLVEFNGTYFNEGTPERVMQVLSDNVHSQNRLRLWYGKDGKSWSEENDICGYVGRSWGTKKITILLHKSGSSGGGAILTDCIVKIVNIRSGVVLYEHENFSQPEFIITDSDLPDYSNNVIADNTVYARFKTFEKAQRYADFMNGKRHSK